LPAFLGCLAGWLQGMALLTGPNMAGKSTILRSVCAVALLGACGLYAPARAASVPYFGEAPSRPSPVAFLLAPYTISVGRQQSTRTCLSLTFFRPSLSFPCLQ
jgi:hypothetical protein